MGSVEGMKLSREENLIKILFNFFLKLYPGYGFVYLSFSKYYVCSQEKSNGQICEGDVSGAVRELASAEGLAPQDGDTLRALKEKHPSAPENP